MANITPQQLFPSAKFISTNNKGDLQEIHSIDAVKASLVVESLLIEATDGGSAGNSISFEMLDSGRTSGDLVVFSATGNDIVADVRLTASGANPNAGSIATSFVNDASSDIKDLISISIVAGATSVTMNSIDHAQANLVGGQDEQSTQDLDSSSTYLLIKTDDIADLEASEQSDGRKVLYGLIDKANESFSSLADAPSNLKISNSNPIFNSSTNTIFKSYLIETFLSFQGLDVKDES